MTNKLPFKIIGFTLVTLIGLACSLPGKAADGLEGLFSQTGWDKVIGTWTSENGTETTFSWKDGEVHSVTKMGDTERNTTIKLQSGNKASVDSKDNKGGTSSGTAEFMDGKAVFTITSKPAGGEERNLTIHYALPDADTLTVQLEGQPESITFKRK